MLNKHYAIMALAFGAALAGCTRKADPDVGSATVSVHQALQISDISSMTVQVQGSALSSPLVVPLVQKGNQFSAIVSSLPVGTDYVFTASGKNAGGTALYQGSVSNQTIERNKTANIVINMNQVAPGSGLVNSAPFIDSLSASATLVAQGDVVTVLAEAHDPDAGQTALLTWGWNATCGVVGAPVNTAGTDTVHAKSQIAWTAPAADGTCTINLTVTDANGVLTNVASISIGVNAASSKGNAKITALPNTFPVVTSLNATPVPLNRGVATTLTVLASDPDGDALTYAWSSPCAGAFSAATAATTTFTLDNASTATSCAFAVVITDGTFADGSAKGSISSSLTLPVSGPSVAVSGAPVLGTDYQTADTLVSGEVVNFAIVAKEGCAGGTITLAYSSNGTGAIGSTTPAALGLDPTVFHASAATYTVAAADTTAVVVQVRATCSVDGSFTDHQFLPLVPAGSFCAGKTDGTDCTASARATNLCVTAAACQSGVCATTTQVACSAAAACKTNTCNAATGLCEIGNAANSTTCSDGLNCTSGDICTNGTCGGTAVACAASGNVCAINACSEATGACALTNAPDTTLCADASGCTGTTVSPDHCSAGVCVAGAAVDCGANMTCTSTSATTYTCDATTPVACMVSGYSRTITPPTLGMANAPDGTVWTTGNLFTGAPGYDFGNGSPVASTGSSDVFLAKINPATGAATAAFGFGDPAGNDQFASGIAVAGNGAPAIIGNLTAEVDFAGISVDDGCTTGTDCLTSTSPVDFFAVFDSAGAIVKAHMANVGTGSLLSIGSNPTQNAFAVCGRASAIVPNYTTAGGNKGLLLIPSGAGYTNAAGGSMDIVVAKIDATTGAVVWGRQIGGAGNQSCNAVTVDNNGDVILTGVYNGDLNFGGATTALPTLGTVSSIGVMYVAKLNGTNGAALSAKAFGTTGVNIPKTITVDANSNILLAGALAVGVDFGNGVSVASLGLTDAFVAKFNASLVAQWAKSYGDDQYNQQVYSVATSSAGDVYVAGLYSGSMGALGISSQGNSTADAFLAQLSGTDGSTLCVKSYGDASGGQEIDVVTVARTATGALANNVVLMGAYSNSIQFAPLTALTTSGPSVAASFVAGVH